MDAVVVMVTVVVVGIGDYCSEGAHGMECLLIVVVVVVVMVTVVVVGRSDYCFEGARGIQRLLM